MFPRNQNLNMILWTQWNSNSLSVRSPAVLELFLNALKTNCILHIQWWEYDSWASLGFHVNLWIYLRKTHIRPPGSVGKKFQKLKDFLTLSDRDSTRPCFILHFCVRSKSALLQSLSISFIVYKIYSALIHAEVVTVRIWTWKNIIAKGEILHYRNKSCYDSES